MATVSPVSAWSAAKAARKSAGSQRHSSSNGGVPVPVPVPATKENDAGSGNNKEKKEQNRTRKGGRTEEEERQRDERLHKVLEQLYGPSAHYRAAKKFLKNRTLRKMTNNSDMTLYDRIMAYRRLKGDEPEEAFAQQVSPHNLAAAAAEPGGSLQAVNPQREAGNSTSSAKPGNDTPTRRAANSYTPGKKLQRSDTSFASVDISDLTQGEEDKDCSPSPQPTFEDRPQTTQAGRNYEEKATARDVKVEIYEKNSSVTETQAAATVANTAVVTAAAANAVRASRERSKDQETHSQNVSDKEKHRHVEELDASKEGTSKNSQKTDKHDSLDAKATSMAIVAEKAAKVSSSKKETDNQQEKSENRLGADEDERQENVQKHNSQNQDKSFIKEASDKVRASITEPRSLETTLAAAGRSSAVEYASAVAASGATLGEQFRKSKSRPMSPASKARKQEDDDTIAALDKLADKKLNSLLGKDDGSPEPKISQKILDKVFSPKFQTELDDFLRTT